VEEALIAPCGMNCNVCAGYLAFQNRVKDKGTKMPSCTGCRPRDKKCAFLKKRCARLLNHELQYCYECPDYPCPRLAHIDRRYRNFFRMSLLENLEFIREKGIAPFLEKEAAKWRCPECGDVICCHNGLCFKCGLEGLKNKKKRYRWEDD